MSCFSQQVVACKIEVVASKGVGAHKHDNVHKINITYHIKKKRFFPLWVSSGMYVSVYFMCVIDVEYSIGYFPELL